MLQQLCTVKYKGYWTVMIDNYTLLGTGRYTIFILNVLWTEAHGPFLVSCLHLLTAILFTS